MSFFTNLRADRLITEIRSATDPASPATQKAIAQAEGPGPGRHRAGVRARCRTPTRTPPSRSSRCSRGLVSQKTFPLFVRGLVEGSPRVIAGISWALTSSRNYPPHLLLEALGTPGSLQVRAARGHRGAEERASACASCCNAAYTQEPNEKAALFRIIGEIADANAVPELIGRVQGKDPIARVHIINILARFNTPGSADGAAGRCSRTPTS